MDKGLETKLRKVYNTYISNAGKIPRAVQEALTVDIAQNLFGTGAYFAESKTGTGKTLAYLLAAAFYIKHGNAKDRELRVTIATPQKHLQQEIMRTFEGMVQAVPEFSGITIANIKGRRNYVSTAKISLLDEYLKKACTKIDRNTADMPMKTRLKEELAAAIRGIKAVIEECGGDLDLIEERTDVVEYLQDTLLPPGESLRDVLALCDEDDPAPAPASGRKGKGAKKKSEDAPLDQSDAYYRAARARAGEGADIVVTNHTLLLISGRLARLNQDMIPLVPMKNLIIDEAHSLVRAARDVWHQRVAISHVIDEMMRLAVETEKEGTGNARAKAAAVDKHRRVLAGMRDDFRSRIARTLGGSGAVGTLDIPTIFIRDPGDNQYRIREFVDDALSHIDLALCDILGKDEKKQNRKMERLPKEQREHAKELQRCKSILSSFSKVFDEKARTNGGANGYGYYVAFSPVHNEPTVGRLPQHIGWYLDNALWSGVESATMLSGTIADVNEKRGEATQVMSADDVYIPWSSFATIRALLGLGEKSDFILERHMSVSGHVYKPPFSWDNVKVHLYKPNVVPPFRKPEKSETENKEGDPAEKNLVQAVETLNGEVDGQEDQEGQEGQRGKGASFSAEERAALKKEIAAAIAPLIDAALHGHPRPAGGALVLLPSYEDLEFLREDLEYIFANRRTSQGNVRNILAQKQGGPSLNALVKEFKAAPGDSVLLSVGAWEGVDLPGDRLTRLFIVRAPHASPDDPVFRLASNYRSRGVMFVRKKAEEFWRFLQGLGRLLRREGDHGEIHIFDSRLFVPGDTFHDGYREYIESEFDGHIEYHEELSAAANE